MKKIGGAIGKSVQEQGGLSSLDDNLKEKMYEMFSPFAVRREPSNQNIQFNDSQQSQGYNSISTQPENYINQNQYQQNQPPQFSYQQQPYQSQFPQQPQQYQQYPPQQYPQQYQQPFNNQYNQ